MNFIIRGKSDKERAKDFIDALGFSPVHVVEMKEYKKNRSLAQNATFHMWIKLIADHTGYTLEEAKDKIVLWLWKPVSREIRVKVGDRQEVYTLTERRKTSTLSKEEMNMLMNATAIVGDSLDIVLPFPDSYLDTR